MHGGSVFLTNLALVLCLAAVTTVVFQRLHLPVVLGYVLAGFVTGPHCPLPLVANQEVIETLSELGVILVMFSLGLEFSLRRLFRLGPAVALVAVIEMSLMMWLGFSTGRLFHFSTAESVLTAGAVAVSSTTIIAKTFGEQKITGRSRDLVFGVLVFEDLISVLLLAALPALVSRSGGSFQQVAATAGQLGVFLVVALVFGMLLVPRLMRHVVRLNRPETTTVASIGLCFAAAVLVRAFGYSAALGAFLAGSLVAESGEAHHVEELVRPVRDVFAAIFFVSIGMLIDPALLGSHVGLIVVLTLAVVIGKLGSVSIAAFLAGNGTRQAVQAGMSLAQIGELSFIVVGLGERLGVVRSFLFPVVVCVSVLTTLLTPWLVRASGPIAALVDRRLPHALQTFAVLYGTWLERLGSRNTARTHGVRLRRMVRYLLIDAALLAGVVIVASLGERRFVALLGERLSLSASVARVMFLLASVAVALPFFLGLIRLVRRLGLLLALMALPQAEVGQLDLAAAPRRTLVVTLQIAVLLFVGVPIVAVTQPFLPPFEGALVLLLLAMGFGVTFWRRATSLDGHVRAGAQVIVEMLAAQSTAADPASPSADQRLTPIALPAMLDQTLPGLGTQASLRLEAGSPAVGQTLAALNLRGLTGASVMAIRREDGGTLVPTGQEALRQGDVLALAGTRDAIDAARRLLEAEQPRRNDAA